MIHVLMYVLLATRSEAIEVYRGKLEGSKTPFGHFFLQLNGNKSVLLDTGSQVAWLKSATGVPTYGCNVSLVYGTEGPNRNSVGSTSCATMKLGFPKEGAFSRISWNSSVAVINQSVPWWPADGMLGASMASEFAKAFPIFTIVPKKEGYSLFVGRFQPTLLCTYLPVTPRGLASGKWIVAGTLAGVAQEFEIDTGFPPVGLSREAWNAGVAMVKERGGIVTGETNGGYGQIVRNCSKRMIPEMEYCFGKSCFVVPVDSFVSETAPGICIVYVLPHDGEYNYIGSALLRDLTVRFDALRKRVGLCSV